MHIVLIIHYITFCRLCISALHFNENGQRYQATTKDGEVRWQISYPKGKKGEQAVVKPCKTAVTYGMYYILCDYLIMVKNKNT